MESTVKKTTSYVQLTIQLSFVSYIVVQMLLNTFESKLNLFIFMIGEVEVSCNKYFIFIFH